MVCCGVVPSGYTIRVRVRISRRDTPAFALICRVLHKTGFFQGRKFLRRAASERPAGNGNFIKTPFLQGTRFVSGCGIRAAIRLTFPSLAGFCTKQGFFAPAKSCSSRGRAAGQKNDAETKNGSIPGLYSNAPLIASAIREPHYLDYMMRFGSNEFFQQEYICRPQT